MKKLKRRFRLRTVLLTGVTVALIASSAAFAVVSAAENVTPTDATPSDFVLSEEITQKDTAEPPENLGEPAITMTTEMDVNKSMSIGIEGTDVYIDPGDGNLIAYDASDVDIEHPFTLKGSTVALYGNITKLSCWDRQLTALNVSNNPALTCLYCGNNRLKSLDVSQNTALTSLNVWDNQLSALNVSNNTELTSLDCSCNDIKALDVSHNTALKTLEFWNNQLTTLDVSAHTALEELDCSWNQLTALNVSNSTDLKKLSCVGNKLNSLNISSNAPLTYLNFKDNYLPLSTIGAIDGNAIRSRTNEGYSGTFCYAPQYVSIPESAESGEEIDLSSVYSYDGTVTEFTWYDSDGNIIIPATSENGVFTFGDNAVGKRLVCKMTNAEFPDFCIESEELPEYDDEGNETGGVITEEHDNRLTTTEVTIEAESLGEPAITLTTEMQVGDTLDIGIEGTDVSVDWGDGQLVEYGDLDLEYLEDFDDSKETYNLSVELKSQTVKLYGNITGFSCMYTWSVTSLNVSQCVGLKYLQCRGNNITMLDVSNNPALLRLDCSENNLAALDVSHNTDLVYLRCPGNQLTSLDVSNNMGLEYLYCMGNQMTELDVSDNTALLTLGVGPDPNGNSLPLTSLDVSHNTSLEKLDIAYSSLTSLDLSHNTRLKELWIWASKLTSLDLSNNTQLTSMDVTGDFTAVDVSHNTALKVLWCAGKFTMLDLSNNTALVNLGCFSRSMTTLNLSNNTALEDLRCRCQLTELDVSYNTSLKLLECESNKLTSLDLSNNVVLERLDCSNNQLQDINISHNELLTELSCYNNYLSLSTIDAISAIIADRDGYFTYAPQYVRIPESVQSEEEIDLSSVYSYDGTVTEFTWYNSDGNTVTPATADRGRFTFGADAVGKTLVCKMTNAKFPDFSIAHYEYPIADDEGNETGEIESWDDDNRLTTTEVTILGESSEYLTVKAGELLDLAALLNQHEEVTGTVTWSSSNRHVATVDSKGMLKALAGGTTTVKARCGSYLHSFIIDVEKAVILNKYELSFTRTTAKPSPIATLTAKKPADVQNVVWYSDNPEVATVTDRGAVKAVGAGVANIYCDDTEGNAESIACVVTVEDFIITGEDENFKGNQAYVLTGETADLALLNANHGTITWKSSNAAVASVDGSGRVTAKKAGTVTITATAADKKASDSIKLTVVAPTESLTVTGVPSFVYVDQMATLKATLTKGSTDKVFWSSADESVATVDANGKIKGIAQGETTVTATTFSGKSQTVPVVVRTKAASVSWTTGHPDMSIAKTVKFGIAAEQQLNLAIKIDAPADCNDTVTWKSSNAKVATVEPSADGQSATVTGVAKGTAVITVRTGSGKTLTATVSVVTVPAEQITLNKNSASLYVGSSLALSAKLAPKGCNDVIIWSSSDPNVASVNENGSVKALSAGTATITAYSAANGEIRDTAEITVRTKATKIEWVGDDAGSVITKELRKGIQPEQTLTLSVNIVSPENCSDTVTWTTSSAKVATVTPSADGRSATVTGIAKGTAVITAKTGSGKKLTARVAVVSVPATAVTLNKKQAALYAGSSVTLSAKTQPKGCNDMIRWSSSDPAVATVNESGSVKAVSTGTATITAYSAMSGEIRDTAEITVRTKATQVEWVNDDDGSIVSKELRRGMLPEQTLTLSVNIVSPENCSDTVTWTTGNAKAATVEPSEDGRSATVTAKASGTAVITAKTGSGKKLTARVTVVTVPAASLTLNKQNVSVYTGASVTLTAKTQSKTCNDVIRWTSSDRGIVTVNENGSVKGIAQGTATVTAYSAIDGEIRATAEITVRTKAQKLVINATDVNLAIDEEDVLLATLTPDGSNDTVTWSISNPKIAALSFDEYGNTVVKGLAKGSAVVTVKTGSGKKATVKVVVVG